MKKIILLALTAIMIAGCNPNSYKADETEFSVHVLDSCEYYIRVGLSRGYMSHKGNCRFCKERRQKELEELVTKLKEK